MRTKDITTGTAYRLDMRGVFGGEVGAALVTAPWTSQKVIGSGNLRGRNIVIPDKTRASVPTSSLYARVGIPFVTLSGHRLVDADPADVARWVNQVAEYVAPMLVAETAENDLDRAAREFGQRTFLSTDPESDDPAMSHPVTRVGFALARPQQVNGLWVEHVAGVALTRQVQARQRRETEEKHAEQVRVYDSVVDVVQAAFAITPGTEERYIGETRRRLPHHIDPPKLYADGSRKARPVSLSWEELAAIVTAAQQHGAAAARAGEDVESAGWALREIAQRRA